MLQNYKVNIINISLMWNNHLEQFLSLNNSVIV